MCNLCNDSKFTLRHKQVTGLVVLAQHYIGVTDQTKNLSDNAIFVSTAPDMEFHGMKLPHN